VRPLNVALLFNLKKNAPKLHDGPPDAWSDLDSESTVHDIAAALKAAGHHVYPMEGDASLYQRLRRTPIDIAFNICEGHHGDSREAQVPALLEMLRIPYTGSQVLTLALTLDKPMTKHVLRDHGLPTPPFQVFETGDEPLAPDLRFPLFVKPSREGTGMGCTPDSVVHDQAALRRRVRYVIEAYRQPALVERFIEGREVTVGLVGNARLHVFPILEIDMANYPAEEAGIYTHRLKVDLAEDYHILCPAPLEPELTAELQHLAIATFRATRCKDVARIDFRLDATDGNKPYILEINPLPGLSKVSDLILMAEAEGWSQFQVIQSILNLAVERYGLERETVPLNVRSARRNGRARALVPATTYT